MAKKTKIYIPIRNGTQKGKIKMLMPCINYDRAIKLIYEDIENDVGCKITFNEGSRFNVTDIFGNKFVWDILETYLDRGK